LVSLIFILNFKIEIESFFLFNFFRNIYKNQQSIINLLYRQNIYCTKLINHAYINFFLQKMRNPKMKEMLLNERLSAQEIEGMVNLFLENVRDGTWKNQGWPEIWTDYAVSKLALNAYSRVLAKQYEDFGLSVNCFCPGFTQTSMTSGKGTHTADDAAEVGARLALLPPGELPTGKFYIGFNPGVISKL
jgi:hypothetical protein